jgi:hypothetical protein
MGSSAACGSHPPPVSHLEDRARLDVPIAICRKPLAHEDVLDGGAPRPDTYFSLVVPKFQGMGTPVHGEDVDCVGESLASDAGATPAITADDLTVVTAADGTQAVWLESARASDAIGDGPLAVVRPRTSDLDLYAIGRYRGSRRHSTFELVGVGTSRVLIARDDGCADVKVDVECDSTLTFFVAEGGQLVPAADSPAQRIRYGFARGVGRVQYRLTTDAPVVDKGTIKVHEKLQVRDSGDEDIRKAEGDRVFAFGPDGQLTAAQPSLWSQLPAKPEPPGELSTPSRPTGKSTKNTAR